MRAVDAASRGEIFAAVIFLLFSPPSLSLSLALSIETKRIRLEFFLWIDRCAAEMSTLKMVIVSRERSGRERMTVPWVDHGKGLSKEAREDYSPRMKKEKLNDRKNGRVSMQIAVYVMSRAILSHKFRSSLAECVRAD